MVRAASWERRDKSAESRPIKDWEVAFPLAALSRIRDRIYLFPLPGVPPFGPGFLPAKGLGGQARDILVEKLSLHVFGRSTGAFNETRLALGLPPLSHPFEQTARVARHVVLTSTAFDFPATSLPEQVVYTGPELDDPEWAEPWGEPWPDSDRRPLVIVGFSSTFQNHASALIRVIEALTTLNVRAVLTAGPALEPDSLPRASNVFVCKSAPHSRLLPKAALMITHGGHGTVIRYFLTSSLALDASVAQSVGSLDQFRDGTRAKNLEAIDVSSTRVSIGIRWYPGR